MIYKHFLKTKAGSAIPLVACLLLAPHILMADAPQPEAPAAGSTRIATLQTSAGAYEFTPKSCLIHVEDGLPDIEIQGPGTAPDGEKLYFDFSSTANEMSIELGVDTPFTSTDRVLTAGQFVSKAFTVEVFENIISVADVHLVDGQGTLIDANASLRIDCSP
ncbi:hypothetical protein [Pseudorhodobacter sp.]|uniref:hypothetical protein n=1 Tax=Pseudorhodobacter sp. TaxID=1934400 RepID=UPI002AFF1332|nr:hypothetical protein [Pseudorhodobacter sp.]